MLNIAVIGLGVGEQHALAYSKRQDCRLRWLYDLDADQTKQVVCRLGQGEVAENFRAILEDESIHLMSIATYDDAHFEQVVAALNAGKHIFVEKPLCRSITELQSIKKTWQANNKHHLVSNLILRAAPVYQWLKGIIEDGALGQIYAFDGEYLYGRIHKITEGWRKNVKDYSVMQGGGVHLIDLMLWLTGERPVKVCSAGNKICTAGTEFRYNDFMTSTYQFESGLIGRITANFGCVHRHQHVVRIFGTKGTFIYDDCGPRLHTSRDEALFAADVGLPTLPTSKGDLIPGFVENIIKGQNTNKQTQHEFDLISACVAADLALTKEHSIQVEYV
ncbi:MAG: Gfo/Idh/MocA family protein [bacterium]